MADTSADNREMTSRAVDKASEAKSETALRPQVDIYEDAEGIKLIADMPGVSHERLNIEVDKDRRNFALSVVSWMWIKSTQASRMVC
jgi:HSP20 family molecular chaperone IbpA